MILRFAANSEKCRKYMFLGGSAQIITLLHGQGGLSDLLQYYNGGGSLGTPNLYYVIYGRPLTVTTKPSSQPPTLKYWNYVLY